MTVHKLVFPVIVVDPDLLVVGWLVGWVFNDKMKSTFSWLCRTSLISKPEDTEFLKDLKNVKCQ